MWIFLIWITGGMSAWAYMGHRDHLFDDWWWYPMAFNACVGGPFTWIAVAMTEEKQL